MPILFIALCISFFVSETYVIYILSRKPKFKTKLSSFIFKYVFTIVAFIFMLAIVIVTLIKSLLLCMLLCISILLFFLLYLEVESKEIMLSIVIFCVTIVVGLVFVNIKIDTKTQKLEPQNILLNDYTQESLKDTEKVIIIELDEVNGKTKSFLIQTYKSNEDLGFFYNSLDEYVTQDIDQNYIEIKQTQKTVYNLLSIFGFKKHETYKVKTYILHVNPNDIVYN